jgi:hypothetical protein
MIAAILLAIVIVVVLPALFFVVGTVFAVLTGKLLQWGAESAHEGSELIPTNY